MTYGSGDRGGVNPIWVTLHSGEGARRAADLAAFLNNNPNASAHATFDAFSTVDMIDSLRYAWTLGSGNRLSINGEACAFAMMTREQWLSPTTITFWNPDLGKNVTVDNPRDVVRRAAAWARRECERWNIPKRILTVQQCAAGWAGIIDHRTYNRAYNAGDHWDVGDGFPWDVFLADVLGQTSEDEMLTPNDGNTRWAAANPYLPDNSPNKVETHPVAGWIGFATFHALEGVRIGKQNQAILTRLASDPDITPAALEEIVRRSDAEHAPVVAGLVVAGVNAELRPLVQEALETVQAGGSEADVTALLRRIATLIPEPVGN